MTLLQAACSEQYEAKLARNYRYYLDNIVDRDDPGAAFEMFALKSLPVDTANAQCSSKRDEDMIRGRIADEGGFELVDMIIFQIRKRMMRTFKGVVDVIRLKPITANSLDRIGSDQCYTTNPILE